MGKYMENDENKNKTKIQSKKIFFASVNFIFYGSIVDFNISSVQ